MLMSEFISRNPIDFFYREEDGQNRQQSALM
jgi:hypothetical protein